MIELMRRVDQNWAEGKLNGAIGIFPLNYVKVNESARSLLEQPAPSHRSVHPTFYLPPHTPPHLPPASSSSSHLTFFLAFSFYLSPTSHLPDRKSVV